MQAFKEALVIFTCLRIVKKKDECTFGSHSSFISVVSYNFLTGLRTEIQQLHKGADQS